MCIKTYLLASCVIQTETVAFNSVFMCFYSLSSLFVWSQPQEIIIDTLSVIFLGMSKISFYALYTLRGYRFTVVAGIDINRMCSMQNFINEYNNSSLVSSNASLDILIALLVWACGIRKSNNFTWQVIRMLIMLVVEWIGRACVRGTCFFLRNCLVSWSS